jgi:outer membrane protein assembly factor BamD
MNYLVNALAEHEVNVARYYYQRGAYLAAVNRVESALTQYPQAPALEEGLYLMMKSYEAMGITDLRDDTHKVMQKNFPQSKYLTGDAGKRWWKFW